MTGEVTRSSSRGKAMLPAGVTSVLLDVAQANVYAGLADGRHRLVSQSRATERRPTSCSRLRPRLPISALTLLIGDRSLIVGRESGAIEVWFPAAGAAPTARCVTRGRSRA